MSSQRLLIRNGFVVSMDPQVGDIPSGDVFVDDGKIVEVGRGLDITDAEIVDATGMLGSMDATGVQSLLTEHSPGVSTILAPIQPGEAEKISVPVVVERTPPTVEARR